MADDKSKAVISGPEGSSPKISIKSDSAQVVETDSSKSDYLAKRAIGDNEIKVSSVGMSREDLAAASVVQKEMSLGKSGIGAEMKPGVDQDYDPDERVPLVQSPAAQSFGVSESAEKSAANAKRNSFGKWTAEKEDLSRVQTGIEGLDDLIEGGFEKEAIVLVVGSAGTGKTLLGMQFLYNGAVKYNEPGVFISFEEEKEPLFRHARQFGWDFDDLENKGKFKLIAFKPHQVTAILEEGGGQIRDTLAELGAKRIVVDSITAYGLLFSDEYKRREKILEFFNLIRKWGITAMVICEDTPKGVESEEGSIGFISDAIISMYYQHDEEKGIRIHSLEIVKMRGTQHTNKMLAINFEKDGLVIYPEVEVF